MNTTTERFKTKTEFIERENLSVDNIWGVALDIGYSAVKGISPNSVYRFPSYARKSKQLLSFAEPEESDIYYRDMESGEIWVLGERAQSLITLEDTTDSSLALYGRNRYFEPSFLIIARVGIAMGMRTNNFGSPNGKPLVLETGLPPKYIKKDSELLKEVLIGHHSFEVKIGTNPWEKFEFELSDNTIQIMPQPMGTLVSISTDKDGNKIPESKNYFSKNLLIFDPGFGTFDVFDINGGQINNFETFDTLGMKRVFEETCNEIYKKFKIEISVPALQNYLENGVVSQNDRKTMTTINVPFDDILLAKSEMVCNEAIEKVKTLYNNLFEHNYLVVTGGTGAAWGRYVQKYFSGLTNLKVIAGSQNDELSCVFSNVRGYYMYLLSTLKKQQA